MIPQHAWIYSPHKSLDRAGVGVVVITAPVVVVAMPDDVDDDDCSVCPCVM